MPSYKLDLIFQAEGRGWQESYYRDFPDPNFASAFGIATQLAFKRIVLSAPPVVIKAYRMQDPLTEGRQGSVFYFNPTVKAIDPGDGQGAASPDTAINTTWVDNATNSTRTLQLRGVWDSAVTQFNQLQSPAYAQWNQLFGTYRDWLIDKGFGWLSRAVTWRNIPVSYSLAPDPLVPLFTFPAATFNILDLGKFKVVRFSKFNGSKSELNRELVVEVVSTTTAKAAAPIATSPMLTGGRAIVYGTPTLKTAETIGVTRVGRRAPGAPLLYTPGRRRNRART